MDPTTRLLLAKARQAELLAEAEKYRLAREFRRSQKEESKVGATATQTACSRFDRLVAFIRRTVPARLVLPRA